MYFEFAIRFYPDSANTYDSMSVYYKGIGDKVNALKFASKAFEISQSDYHKLRIEKLKGK
jgi:hypothetical protein